MVEEVATSAPAAAPAAGGTKVFTLEECKAHRTEKDCWLIIHGKVYDVTEFLDEHPGARRRWATFGGGASARPLPARASDPPPALCRCRRLRHRRQQLGCAIWPANAPRRRSRRPRCR